MSQQINLFNPVFLEKGKHFSAMAMAQALAIVIFGASAIGVYTTRQITVVKRETDMVAARLKNAQSQLNIVSNHGLPKEKSKALEEEIRIAEADIRSEQKVIDFLKTGEFGNTRGYSEYLKAFGRQIGSGIWLTSFTVVGPGSELGVQGRALRPELIPAYLGRLKNEPILHGKSFAAIDIKTVQPESPADQGKADQGKAQPTPVAPAMPSSSVRSATSGPASNVAAASGTPEGIVQAALQIALGQGLATTPAASPAPARAAAPVQSNNAASSGGRVPGYVEFSIVSTGFMQSSAQESQPGAQAGSSGPMLSLQFGGQAK
jgi:hypothetical protein